MVLDHEIKENTGLGNKGWVQGFAPKRLKRNNDAALKYMRKSGGEIWDGLMEREVFLGESEGKVLHVRYGNYSHYSLPNSFSTSPYSRTVLSIAASIRFFPSSVTVLPRMPATVRSVMT